MTGMKIILIAALSAAFALLLVYGATRMAEAIAECKIRDLQMIVEKNY